MSQANMTLELARAAAKHLGTLDNLDCNVEMVTDFEAVPGIARIAGREFQMPTFNISRADHTATSAYWLFLRRGDDYLGGVAAMLQDLGREDYQSFAKRTARHHFPRPDGNVIERVATPIVQKMRGRLIYIGELTFREDARGNRPRLEAFMRLNLTLSLLQWDCDWVYAFIPDRHARAGLDKVYGFPQSLPRAQVWSSPEPEVRSSSEWWVGGPRAELEHVLAADVE